MTSYCKFVKTSGERCRARPITDSQYCFFHDPESTDRRVAGRKAGGKKGKRATLPRQTPHRVVLNAGDVVSLLSDTINQTLRGEIDPKVANAVGYLSGIILRAREQGELEERLRAVEIGLRETRKDSNNVFEQQIIKG